MDALYCQDLYTTLEGAFPKAIMPTGLEHALKCRIRKKLRTAGWDTLFRPGEDWKRIIEGFAFRGLDKVYTAYGYNPWFWAVAWPAVLGAAAADFWPRVATSLERRFVAHAASKERLEAPADTQGHLRIPANTWEHLGATLFAPLVPLVHPSVSRCRQVPPRRAWMPLQTPGSTWD